MNTKHSPRKVTLVMLKGKPITTSVPVIHFHASDDELEEIYPSTDEEKRLIPECERISSKLTSSPQKCTEKRSTQESDISESNSECRSMSAENIKPEGTPPSLAPWKMLSDIRGKLTKTFEEKLSEIKSDKKKSCHSRAESSSISDSEDQGSVTPCDDRTGNDKQTNEPTSTIVHRRSNPVRYVGFSGVKTGLKDKSLQEECVESGIEASEFSPDTDKDPAPTAKTDVSLRKSLDSDNLGSIQKQTSYVRSTVFSTQTNFKVIFSHLLKQLACQLTYRSVAALVAVFCIYYVTPLPEYLTGLVTGVVATIIFYNTISRFKMILINLPDETFPSRPVVSVLEIPAVEEHAAIERFQGWLNELPYHYEPTNYHVARTKSVFFRLEGSILRIMETRMKVPKKAVWNESQLKLKFIKKRVYNLSGAKVELVPCGLARRRRWSKKYPICITLKRKEAHVCNVMFKGAMNDECYSTNNGQGETILDSNAKEGESVMERLREQKQEDGEEGKRVDEAEVLLEEDVEDTAELDDYEDDVENFYSDFDNDEFDNEYVEYKRQVLEDGTVEDICRSSKKKSGKNRINNRGAGEKENDSTSDRNANKCHSCGYSFIERRKKKRRMILKQVKFGKRLNSKDTGRLTQEEQDRYHRNAKKREEGDRKEELSDNNDQDGDGNDDDDDDDDEDDDDDGDGDEDEDYDDDDDDDYDDNDDDEDDDDNNESDEIDENNDEIKGDENKMLESKKKMREIKIEFESLEGGEEKEEKREGTREKEKEEDKDEWETIDGAGGGGGGGGGALQVTRSQKNSRKKRRNSRRMRNRIKIFIFARADREKEDWYRRLVSASTRRVKKQDASSCFATDASSTLNTTLLAQRTVTTESKLSASTNNSFENVPELNYNAYMAKHLENSGSTFENEHSPYTDNTLWINCLVARILFDVHRCPETVTLIQDKIQRKLSSIKLPYFMECLLVSEVAVGQGSPIIRNITKPMTNERGLWLDVDITYKGSLTMTVETKLNLMKLTRTGTISGGSGGVIGGGGGDNGGSGNLVDCSEKDKAATKSPIFDSDMEDTPETSTEDDDSSQLCSPAAKETTPSAQSSGRKFLNIVDRIAANKYFQHATELSYVRRAMEGFSNTEIRLMVTVSSIEGCLSLNIPPPPSDRLWYGFKPVPKVTLTVQPAVGERAVNIAYITKWIEEKLLREFEKLVVLPNMDDLVLPLCPNYPYTSTR